MERTTQQRHGSPYLRLHAMVLFSFLLMYGLMYAMVDRMGNVLPNLNQFYMAGLMAAPMAILELIVMRGMYPNRKANAVLVAVSIAAMLAFWFGIREQAGIGDRQLLKSMIPHHAGAILMCERAELTDPDIRALCDGIVAGQQTEIDRMKAKLRAAGR